MRDGGHYHLTKGRQNLHNETLCNNSDFVEQNVNHRTTATHFRVLLWHQWYLLMRQYKVRHATRFK